APPAAAQPHPAPRIDEPVSAAGATDDAPRDRAEAPQADDDPDGWRARDDDDGRRRMPRWLYRALYGEAPPDDAG
ncbi:MAG: hypothetical protein H6742_12425, partial [Alphaproteobacteria bacterium]|nr:hypothetical protein [Alphaproteobacteria bacterium]